MSLRSLLAVALIATMAFPASAQDMSMPDFWKEFSAAIRLADTDAMVKLARKHPNHTRDAFLEKIQKQLSTEEEDPALKRTIDYIKRAWRGGVGNELLHAYEQLLNGMTAEQRVERAQLELEFRSKLGRRINEMQRTPDPDKLPQLIDDLMKVAMALEEAGDGYWAGEAWFWCAQQVDSAQKQMIRGGIEDAIAAYEKCMNVREAFVGQHDEISRGAENQIKRLKRILETGSESEQPEGAEGAIPEPTFAPGSKWITLAVETEKVRNWERMKWPGHISDDFFVDWMVHPAGAADGESTPMHWFAGAPVIHRDGGNRYFIDTNGDKKSDGEFKQGAKPQLIEIKRKIGRETESYYLVVAFGGSQMTVQGLAMNVAPSPKQSAVYFRSATATSGKIVDEAEGINLPITIYDENVSGSFGDNPALNLWGTKFGEENVPVMLFDSMIVGKAKRPVPFSGYLVIDSKVYRIKFKGSDQREMSMRRCDIGTGTAMIKANGFKIPLTSLAIAGVGPLTGAFYELANAKKGVEVPEGQYQIAIGTFRSGKGMQIQKMMVTQGDMPLIEVKKGETTEIEIGKPFKFDFDYSDYGPAISVPGEAIAVRGKNGELYTRFTGVMIQPNIYVRKKGSKGRGGKPTSMKPCDQETFRQSSSREIIYHPLEIEVRKPSARVEVEVMLEQKGHKWFGTITSDWF